MTDQSESEIKGKMKEQKDQTRTKWQIIKQQLLGEEAKYTKLKEDLVGYIGKESDLNGWIRKAEDVCGHVKDIEQNGSADEIFKTFEVCLRLCF